MEKKKTFWTQSRKYLPLYLMMLPGILYAVVNNYLPMSGLIIAFKRYNYRSGFWGSPFVGLKNFEFLFRTRDALQITQNTLAYNGAFILLDLIASILIAVLLNEVRSAKAKKIYQTVILIPFLISMVIVSYLVSAFLNTNTGFVNKTILPLFGQSPVTWYASPQYWPVILVFVHMWKGIGYKSIIYYATLIGIDPTYYEAARIDGANKWEQFVHVTLPGLLPTILTLVLMSVGRIFYSDFGLFYQVPMNSGALLNVTNTIDTYVYRGLFAQNNISMASAAGFYQSVVGFVLVLTANFIVKKIDPDNALF
jgi:putative aldouronate transport system permease protein